MGRRLKSIANVTSELLGLPTVFEQDPDYVEVPYTRCAIRVPQATGALVGLDVGRDSEYVTRAGPPGTEVRHPNTTGPAAWIGYELEGPAERGWRIAWRGRARQAVIEELVAGPVNELLAAPQPQGLRVRFLFGTLVVEQRGFVTEPAALDALATTASSLARDLRAICRRQPTLARFEQPVPEPEWAAKIERLPKDTFVGLYGQDLKHAAHLARDRGLVSEDPYAFHLAFADLPVPGEAFAVYRGTLPGTDVSGRLVSAIERPLRKPPRGWDRYVSEMPHGEHGCDTALVPLRAGVEDAHGDAGAPWPGTERGRFAIRRGILVAWRPRRSAQADGPELDELGAAAVSFARENGLL